MLRKGNAPECAGTQTEAMLAEAEMATIHHSDNITGTGQITRLLLHGHENAISSADLLRLTRYENIRNLRQAIEKERRAGTPILTCKGNKGGYFLPSEEPTTAIAELRAFIHLQTGKGIGLLRSTKAAKKRLAELQRQAGGQERMVL